MRLHSFVNPPPYRIIQKGNVKSCLGCTNQTLSINHFLAIVQVSVLVLKIMFTKNSTSTKQLNKTRSQKQWKANTAAHLRLPSNSDIISDVKYRPIKFHPPGHYKSHTRRVNNAHAPSPRDPQLAAPAIPKIPHFKIQAPPRRAQLPRRPKKNPNPRGNSINRCKS